MMGILMNKRVQLERIWRGLIEGYFFMAQLLKALSLRHVIPLSASAARDPGIELTVDYATLRRETSEYGNVQRGGPHARIAPKRAQRSRVLNRASGSLQNTFRCVSC